MSISGEERSRKRNEVCADARADSGLCDELFVAVELVHFGICTVFVHKLRVGALFLDAVFGEYDYAVAVFNGGEAVSYRHRRSALGKTRQAVAHKAFAFVVKRTRGIGGSFKKTRAIAIRCF